MPKSPLNILCATDDNYVPYCGIMLTSLFENNREEQVNVYVIIDKPLSSANSKRFQRLAAKYGQKIELVMIDKTVLSQFPTKGMDYWSIAMYYRIFAADLLPQNVHRLLYLDCDIIVTGSLQSLMDMDMGGNAIGVVDDIFMWFDDCYERLGYPKEKSYFNSGVLLMNLDVWREQKICQQCMGYLSQNYEKLFANDQDVLNAVLWNKKMALPITYNYQIQFRKKYFFGQYDETFRQEILGVKTPVVIHYAAPIKPWNCLYFKKPYKSEWWHYCRRSQWWYLLPQLPPRKKLNYLIKRYLLWPLGIMWKQEYMLN